MIDDELYHTVLILAGIANLSMGFILLHGNIAYSEYGVYCRARRLVALCFTVFAVGFLLHAHYYLRTIMPAIASALSVSYFHIGGVLFGWSHTSLMRPDYLTWKVVLRDLLILVVGIIAYWTVALAQVPMFNLQFSIFFAHAIYITYTFYHTYYQMRNSLLRRPANQNTKSWWNKREKQTVLNGQRSFVISCHLIVLFGIGSIVVTACTPTLVWPYTVLLSLGILVFTYIFISLNIYGSVVEAGTNATEDIIFK